MENFDEYANGSTLSQLMEFKSRATKARDALKMLEALTGGPEPLSEYLGQSFSNIVDEMENLACAMDSRISDLEEVARKLTMHDVDLLRLAEA